jgi:N-acetylmuramoyl-L-alanine amidase
MKTLSMSGIAIVLLLTGISCNKITGKRRSSLEPFLGALDVPRRGGTLQGATAIVGGWALAEDGVQRVAIYVDKQFVTFATLGGDRPDIAKAFPAFANPGKSGWNVVLDLSSMLEGDHEMVVQVKSNGGNVHDFPPVPFKVVHESK